MIVTRAPYNKIPLDYLGFRKETYAVDTNGIIYGKWGKPMKGTLTKSGIKYSLKDSDDNLVNHYGHRLTARAFLIPPPLPGSTKKELDKPDMYVRHLDGNKRNNNITNLRWEVKSGFKTVLPTSVKENPQNTQQNDLIGEIWVNTELLYTGELIETSHHGRIRYIRNGVTIVTLGEENENKTRMFTSVSSDGLKVKQYDVIDTVRRSFLYAASIKVNIPKDGNPNNNSPDNEMWRPLYISGDPHNVAVPITDLHLLEAIINVTTLTHAYSSNNRYKYLMGIHFPDDVDKPRMLYPKGDIPYTPVPKPVVKEIIPSGPLVTILKESEEEEKRKWLIKKNKEEMESGKLTKEQLFMRNFKIIKSW